MPVARTLGIWLGDAVKGPVCGPRRRLSPTTPSLFPKTLPPIRNQPAPSRPASWDLQIPMEQSSWLCPQPPPPGMLCLGLTARAHGTDYFLANFFSDFPCHFLHR